MGTGRAPSASRAASFRADIDQEGLLAERTLMLAPRRPPRDDGARPGSPQDESSG
jgi:hypothetical protein